MSVDAMTAICVVFYVKRTVITIVADTLLPVVINGNLHRMSVIIVQIAKTVIAINTFIVQNAPRNSLNEEDLMGIKVYVFQKMNSKKSMTSFIKALRKVNLSTHIQRKCR